jgi:hypothetical protein
VNPLLHRYNAGGCHYSVFALPAVQVGCASACNSRCCQNCMLDLPAVLSVRQGWKMFSSICDTVAAVVNWSITANHHWQISKHMRMTAN